MYLASLAGEGEEEQGLSLSLSSWIGHNNRRAYTGPQMDNDFQQHSPGISHHYQDQGESRECFNQSPLSYKGKRRQHKRQPHHHRHQSTSRLSKSHNPSASSSPSSSSPFPASNHRRLRLKSHTSNGLYDKQTPRGQHHCQPMVSLESRPAIHPTAPSLTLAFTPDPVPEPEPKQKQPKQAWQEGQRRHEPTVKPTAAASLTGFASVHRHHSSFPTPPPPFARPLPPLFSWSACSVSTSSSQTSPLVHLSFLATPPPPVSSSSSPSFSFSSRSTPLPASSSPHLTTVTMSRSSRNPPPASSSTTRQNEYFVPRDGIDREVISADICRYLGNDALVRPGHYEVHPAAMLLM